MALRLYAGMVAFFPLHRVCCVGIASFAILNLLVLARVVFSNKIRSPGSLILITSIAPIDRQEDREEYIVLKKNAS